MPKPLPGGFLIVFEGIDGVGKSTQLRLADDALREDGWPTVRRRNMGGTPIGEELRQVMMGPTPRPNTTNLYISVAVQAALSEQIDRDRQAGKLILMDRGPISLAAYEFYGSGLSGELCWPHVEAGMSELRPDLMIVYKAKPSLALDRARQQLGKTDFFESQPPDYFERVAAGYEALAKRYGATVIDAEQSIEAVQVATMAEIQKALAA